MTQRNILLNVLKDAKGWVKSFEIIKVQTRYGWLGTSADRQARQLVEEGLIDRKQIGKYAMYCYKTPRAFGERTVSVQERRKKKYNEVQKSLIKEGQRSLI